MLCSFCACIRLSCSSRGSIYVIEKKKDSDDFLRLHFPFLFSFFRFNRAYSKISEACNIACRASASGFCVVLRESARVVNIIINNVI